MMAALASRSYMPGDLIVMEEPFAQVLPRVLKDKFCESCHRRDFNLRSCKQCLAVKYCGKACQKKDWSADHRLECSNMKNLQEGKSDDIARLLGRVILKIKGKDWKSVKTTVVGTEVNFDDIDCHYKEMTENPHLNLLYREMMSRTKKFIGAENMPSDVDMLKIVGKVIYNSLSSSREDLPGICFFLGLFMFQHECVPNSSLLVIGSNLKVWASKKIVKGSGKITVSYRRLFDPHLRIYKEIYDNCNCSDCSSPYGESVLSKILDDSKAFSVMALTEHLLEMGSLYATFKIESQIKEAADDLLQKHNGVLGRTNILHLKLLGFRYFTIGGRPTEIERPLRELELVIRSVFGECSIELIRIYEYLGIVYSKLGQLSLAMSYVRKLEQLTQLPARDFSEAGFEALHLFFQDFSIHH